MRIPDDLGHFTRLTPEVAARFLAELGKGDWPQLAAFRAGIAPKSVRRWLDKGLEEAAIEPYASFAREVVRVEAELAGRLIEVVVGSALGGALVDEDRRPPNVQSAIWLLQHRFRFFWGGGKDGAPAAVSITEHIERQIGALDESRRQSAKQILAALPMEAKAEARQKGFLL